MAVYAAMYNLISMLEEDIGAFDIQADFQSAKMATISFGKVSVIKISATEKNKVCIYFYTPLSVKSFICDPQDTKEMYEKLWSKEEALFIAGQKLKLLLNIYNFPVLSQSSWIVYSFKFSLDQKYFNSVYVDSNRNFRIQLQNAKGQISYSRVCPTFADLAYELNVLAAK